MTTYCVYCTFTIYYALVTYSNSFIDGSGCHARCQPAHQEEFGVQYLARGHINTPLSHTATPEMCIALRN